MVPKYVRCKFPVLFRRFVLQLRNCFWLSSALPEHYDFLRFCPHTRPAFLACLPPDVLMRPADVDFDPGRGVWGSGFLQRSSIVPVPVLIQDSIVQAILQRASFDTLSVHELAWCRAIVKLSHHQGGLGITPLPASGMAAFYSATAHMVSWLGSLPHASGWVAGQNIADPLLAP